MPHLPEEARACYENAHSAAPRYDEYNDDVETIHGGLCAAKLGISSLNGFPKAGLPSFMHRGEHDVESIFWSMVCALLRVLPRGSDKKQYATRAFVRTWAALNAHEIPDTLTSADHYSDPRTGILEYSKAVWALLFPPQMKDVGHLLWDIANHVRSEYGLWKWKGGEFKPDHLHEAVQRLIFRYLFEHRDKDIELDPACLRTREADHDARGHAWDSVWNSVKNVHDSGTGSVGCARNVPPSTPAPEACTSELPSSTGVPSELSTPPDAVETPL